MINEARTAFDGKQMVPSGLVPMTYDEALHLRLQVKRDFSFVAAPYDVRKTVTSGNSPTSVIAIPPSAHDAWIPGRVR